MGSEEGKTAAIEQLQADNEALQHRLEHAQVASTSRRRLIISNMQQQNSASKKAAADCNVTDGNGAE